jgi:hypothetical protein
MALQLFEEITIKKTSVPWKLKTSLVGFAKFLKWHSIYLSQLQVHHCSNHNKVQRAKTGLWKQGYLLKWRSSNIKIFIRRWISWKLHIGIIFWTFFNVTKVLCVRHQILFMNYINYFWGWNMQANHWVLALFGLLSMSSLLFMLLRYWKIQNYFKMD